MRANRSFDPMAWIQATKSNKFAYTFEIKRILMQKIRRD